MNELALFAGAGGGILGGRLLGWRTRCAVEIDPYCRSVLLARQRDGILEPFPIWDNVVTFDGRPWRGAIDVVSGGFPCQDISAAGKGRGIAGERSGLWKEMARIIREVRPRFAFVENSPVLTSRGLGVVLGDLADMGFDARWGVLSAADTIWADGDPCADHLRERLWIVAALANSGGGRLDSQKAGQVQFAGRAQAVGAGNSLAHALRDGSSEGFAEARCQEVTTTVDPRRRERGQPVNGGGTDSGWWSTEPNVGRVVNGMAHRVDRVKALGNGQVPGVAALAWRLLK